MITLSLSLSLSLSIARNYFSLSLSLSSSDKCIMHNNSGWHLNGDTPRSISTTDRARLARKIFQIRISLEEKLRIPLDEEGIMIFLWNNNQKTRDNKRDDIVSKIIIRIEGNVPPYRAKAIFEKSFTLSLSLSLSLPLPFHLQERKM